MKPSRPRPPAVSDRSWPRNAIDGFVLARLDENGLRPSEEADRARLIRRVYLDLIGLPPTVADVDEFLRDASEGAFEKIVESLLASPRYGEKWARSWLDLARYADSNGFQADQLRDSWAYRDWVIDALNADMPFDRFTVEQIAGDLLPGATAQQRIATGFHRTVTCNVEAGVDPDENRTHQVMDRVNTTATVWLGSTFECAQCHDHKYDPFSQEEYYGLFAFFNNTPLEVELGDEHVRYDFVGPVMDVPMENRDTVRRERLQNEFQRLTRRLDRTPETAGLKDKLADVKRRLAATTSPTTLVMVELDEPRPTHVFTRGDFLSPGVPVTAGVPRALHPMPRGTPPNRLGLAHWLIDANNPLVARVTVNRWWAELFGRGLVRTSEDYGTQGEPPSHPRLLDWLAVELVESGWSMKHIHRLIVTSATYRQSSRVTPQLLHRDPHNRLYARGGRLRLAAETLRDNALAISGLLSTKMKGPPVFPPQPPNLWRQIGRNEPKYVVSTDEDRFRRGVYVVWRRAAPYPSFVNFDAPDRTCCVDQRSRTNTPLQALTLMNDEAFVDCAKALAARMMTDVASDDPRLRVAYAFRLCAARRPSDAETDHLLAVYQREYARYQSAVDRAESLIGPFPHLQGEDRPADVAEWASWFYVASILLNLDETITKG